MQHPTMPYGQPMAPGHAQSMGQNIPMQIHPSMAAPNGAHMGPGGPMMASAAPSAAGGPVQGPGSNVNAMPHNAAQAQLFAQHPGMQQVGKSNFSLFPYFVLLYSWATSVALSYLVSLPDLWTTIICLQVLWNVLFHIVYMPISTRSLLAV